MKKPIIKNWIKYWSTTIAVTGMLAMGACDSNNNTADDAVDATQETINSAREDVSQNLEEMEAETEEVANTEETATARPSYGPSAYTIRNMDAHLERFKEVNEAITETLTDANNQLDEGSTPETYNEQEQPLNNSYENNDTSLDEPATNTNNSAEENERFFEDKEAVDEDQNPAAAEEENNELFFEDEEPAESNQEGNTESMNSSSQQNLSDVSGAEQRTFDRQGFTEEVDPRDEQQSTNMNNQNSAGLENVEDPNTPASLYERHIAVYSEGLSEYAQQRFNDIMSDYLERRESGRGEINEESGAYIAADVDPQPTIGFNDLLNQIEREIEYPRTAAAARVEGIVFVNLVVDENGEIEKVWAMEEFIESPEPDYPLSFTEEDIEEAKEEMKEAAERAVQETSGLWEAAELNGQKVKSEIQIPVQFIMEDTGIGEHEDLGKGVGNPSNVKDINE